MSPPPADCLNINLGGDILIVHYLGRQRVDMTENDVHGFNMFYHFDCSYSPNWSGKQVVKRFIRDGEPIQEVLKTLIPGDVDITEVSIGKRSIITDMVQL